MKLHLLLLLLAFLLVSLPLAAAQRAVVKSEQAIIYAEIQKVTAVGYVSKGKTLKVGEVARGPYRMLPILVSGKICYIQESDLFINEFTPTGAKKVTTAPMQRTETGEAPVEVSSYSTTKRSVEASYNTFSPGDEFNQASLRVNGRESTARATNFSGRYFFSNKWNFNWGLGLDTYGVSDGAAEATTWGAALEVNRTIWEYKDWSLKPSFSLYSSLMLKSNGFRLNAPLVYHLTQNSYIKAGLGYQRVAITDLDIPGTDKVTLSGVNMFAALEYAF